MLGEEKKNVGWFYLLPYRALKEKVDWFWKLFNYLKVIIAYIILLIFICRYGDIYAPTTSFSSCVYFSLEININNWKLENCCFNVSNEMNLICELATKTYVSNGKTIHVTKFEIQTQLSCWWIYIFLFFLALLVCS